MPKLLEIRKQINGTVPQSNYDEKNKLDNQLILRLASNFLNKYTKNLPSYQNRTSQFAFSSQKTD